ncbi:MAG: DUF5689 domain-containing protein [Rikenellaceae bacterium]|nr:DUF5689 domain-containing protein [Rikenellaceae bacterium]
MKAFTKALFTALAALVGFTACEKTPDGPPLNPPSYEGQEANMTIAELKSKYSHLSTWGDIEEIEYEYILKAVVIANDEGGNIYKQMYLRDDTGAINIGVEEGSASSYYRVGQTVYVNLHGLFMVNYGNQLQIGYGDTNANRIPWLVFQEKVQRDGSPDAANAQPIELTLGQISSQYINNLVRFNTVYFLQGGEATFAAGDDAGNRTISDGSSTAVVRTTSYADFASETLPEGSGDLVVILGYYNNDYQLLVRTMDDVINFGGPIPGEGGGGTDPGSENQFFKETFGTGDYPSGNRPYIADFTDFDMKSPVTYSDPTGRADVRSTSTMNAHVWFPTSTGTGTDASLIISGINSSGYSDITLTFELATGLSTDAVSETNLNVMQLTVDGNTIALPSTPVSVANGDNNKFYTFTVTGIPSKADLQIEFFTDTTNISGIRLDNIVLSGTPD